MRVHLYPNWEIILEKLSGIFCFEFRKVGIVTNDFGRIQNSYIISDMCFARKVDLDEFIINGVVGSSEYARASVLYSLYACGYLTINDIEYPTYQDWKNKNYLSLDHKLPKKWFPYLTFDCTNWQPIARNKNKNKGDEFLNEGLERMKLLSSKLNDIKKKYQ